jgi:ABC-type bacteriocin/lantibiotic exporter with double-glycine peptidase domain
MFIEPRMQRHVWDCAITCMEMLLRVPWDDLRAKLRKPLEGMNAPHIQRHAKKFGHTLKWRETSDVPEDAVGILIVEEKYSRTATHAVIYAKDTIYDPGDGRWYMDADEYLGLKQYRVIGILTRRLHGETEQ